MKLWHRVAIHLGRWLLALVFIWGGLSQMIYWSDYGNQVTEDLMQWQLFAVDRPWLERGVQILVPLALYGMVLGICAQLVGGGMILFGWHVRLSALLLIPYLIVHIFFTHPLWCLIEGRLAADLLMQRLAILGGVILLAIYTRPMPSGAPKIAVVPNLKSVRNDF